MGVSAPRLTATQIRDRLQTLTGLDRLDGSAIKGLGNFNLRGTYSGATTYNQYDVVTVNGSSYVWMSSTPGNDSPPSANWQLIAQKGDAGANGGGSGGGLSAWQLKSGDYTASPGDRLRIDASAGSVVISLPSTPSPTDGEIWVQRIDTSGNSVILRSSAKFQGLSGQDALLNDRRVEVVIFADTNTGWLTHHDRLTYQPAPGAEIDLIWQSNGDANGLFYHIGTNGNTTAFTNPAINGLVQVLASSLGFNEPSVLSDRSPSRFWTDNISNSWVAWDLGTRQITVADYTFRTRSAPEDNNNYPRTWTVEGTNQISSWTTTGINSASWTNIDSRSNEFGVNAVNTWYKYSAPIQTAKYRYIRFRQTFRTSSNFDFLCLGEIEFYGKLS